VAESKLKEEEEAAMTETNTLFDKWRSDDTLTLIDYFKTRGRSAYSLETILADLHLLDQLGRDAMYANAKVFYSVVTADGGELTHDWDIAIDAVIDLCVVLLESFRAGTVGTDGLDRNDKSESVRFSIQAEEGALDLLLVEFERFIGHPQRYVLSEMMRADELAAYAADCRAVCEEIRAHLKQGGH
jgi:hypothetical protein